MKHPLLLLIILSNYLYGSNADTLVKVTKWEIGVSFSPDYSYRVLKEIAPYGIYSPDAKQCADSLNTIEKPAISWTVGIPIAYHFNKRVSLRTGIYLSNKTYKSKGFVQRNGVYGGWYIFEKDNWEKQNFLFIEVPIAFQYTISPKKYDKLNISIMAGATACINTQEHYYNSRRYETDYGNQHPELESSYTKLYVDQSSLLYIGFTAGIKFAYKLNNKFMLGIEPVYKYYANEFISTSASVNSMNSGKIPRQIMGITEKPFSYGINISIAFIK
jgi:hypothetical protein